MSMVVLESRRTSGWHAPGSSSIVVRRSLPFAESRAGRYCHRVRSMILHNSGHPTILRAHFSIRCWCGMCLCIGGRNLTKLLAEPSDGTPICATCEGRAIGAGQLGAREIAGRPVMFSPRRSAA